MRGRCTAQQAVLCNLLLTRNCHVVLAPPPRWLVVCSEHAHHSILSAIGHKLQRNDLRMCLVGFEPSALPYTLASRAACPCLP